MELEIDLLKVAEVADGCWRICDRSMPNDDGTRMAICRSIAASRESDRRRPVRIAHFAPPLVAATGADA